MYGIRKVWAGWAVTAVAGAPVARCTVARLMSAWPAWDLAGQGPRTTVRSTAPDTRPDLVDREFTAPAPNHLWVADITYVKTHSGWVYAAFVLDVFSRRIVGWQLSTNLYTDLALDALNMGIWCRQPVGADLSNLIHHSDRGVQYLAIRYTERLAEADVVASVGSVGIPTITRWPRRSTPRQDRTDPQPHDAHHARTLEEHRRRRDRGRRVGRLVTPAVCTAAANIPPAEYEAAYYAEHALSQLAGATP